MPPSVSTLGPVGVPAAPQGANLALLQEADEAELKQGVRGEGDKESEPCGRAARQTSKAADDVCRDECGHEEQNAGSMTADALSDGWRVLGPRVP